MEVNGLTGNAAPSAGQSKSALSSLTDDLDNFLLMLTTQLQHQDPLEPLDSNEFTAQLVQFTGVEQAIRTNRNLEELIGLQMNNQAIGALSFLGQTIEAASPQILLQDGTSEIKYELGEGAAQTVITILDSSGKPVRVATASGSAGEHSFTWDGKDNDGKALPNGVYTVQITAVDAQGKTIDTASPIVTGKVTGVEVKNGEVVLSIGDLEIPASRVLAVREPPAA